MSAIKTDIGFHTGADHLPFAPSIRAPHTDVQSALDALFSLGDAALSVTRADMAALVFPVTTSAIRTTGYAVAGDGGGALYRRSVSEPAHAGKIQSSDGAWWAYVAEWAVNVLSFGADRTGVTDSSTAANNAIAFAILSLVHGRVYFPYGIYLVNSSIIIHSNMIVCGDGPKSTIIRPGVTDGSGVFKIYSGSSFWSITDLSVASLMDFDSHIAGTATPQNCTAILANDVSIGHATRFYIENCYVYGCSVGMNVIGWIATTNKFHIDSCSTGLIGSEFNAVDINIHFENNNKDFSITDSYGVTLRGIVAEGAVNGSLASTVDNVDGLTLISPYWEGGSVHARTEPFLTIGETTICTNVDIIGGTCSASTAMSAGISPIRLDNVETASISIAVEQGAQGHGVETTANTKNLVLRTHMGIAGVPQDNSRCIGKLINYFANSYFETWFRGWGSIQLTRATMSKETTLVRRGLNALKVSATAGNNYNNVSLLLGYGVPVLVRGLTLRVGAWIWVPNITEYDEASRTAWPDIEISSYNGSVAVTSASVNNQMVRNAWNYLTTSVVVQSDATEIYVTVYANNSAINASGNEYLVVDAISVVEHRCSLDDQMNGNYTDSHALPLFFNGRMELVGTPSANANFTYSVADKAWSATVAALGSPGAICTTGGAGNTAVWSNMAPLI